MRALRLIALLLAALVFTSGCTEKNGEGAAAPSPAPTETEWDETPDAEATFRRTTLYFLSDEGYVVPVTKLIPWEEGIARACLACMTSSPANDAEAARLGLKTVIPAGIAFSLTILDGCALIDFKQEPVFRDAAAELAMVEAAVNTLTGFPTVKTVTITVNGKGGSLACGTELPVRAKPYPLNPERSELETSSGASPATLYFPNASGSLTVPVTRYVEGTPSLYSLTAALIRGTDAKGLRSCFPENTLLLGAAVENGVVTVNLSDDFRETARTEGLFTLAKKTLWLTLAERFEFHDLRIQVNGKDYEPESFEAPDRVN